MNPVSRLAFRLGLLRIRERHVERWAREADTPMLVLAAGDRRSRIRIAAVRALGTVGGPEAVALLRVALRDRHGPVALAAAAALRQVDRQASADAAAVEAYWAARKSGAFAPSPTSDGPLIDKTKMERFAAFKREVLAQATRGQFYG